MIIEKWNYVEGKLTNLIKMFTLFGLKLNRKSSISFPFHRNRNKIVHVFLSFNITAIILILYKIEEDQYIHIKKRNYNYFIQIDLATQVWQFNTIVAVPIQRNKLFCGEYLFSSLARTQYGKRLCMETTWLNWAVKSVTIWTFPIQNYYQFSPCSVYACYN